VFCLTVWRDGRKQDAFAKFGPPERLEHETVNCNRLLAAAASAPEGEDLRLRRFFGYSHLSDSNRVLVESHSDFLALFISALHPLSPDAHAGKTEAVAGVDLVQSLSQFRFTVEQQWRTQALIGDICGSLTLLQGKLHLREAHKAFPFDRLPYDDYHRCGRVGELDFASCRGVSESGHSPVFSVERAELLQSGGTEYALRCYVRLVDEHHTIERKPTERADITLHKGDMIRLTLSTRSSPFSGAGAVIYEAFKSDVRVGERVWIDPNDLAKNVRASRVEQLNHLVAGVSDGAFAQLAAPDRAEVIKLLREPLEDLDQIEANMPPARPNLWRITADRIHGDLFLPNILYRAPKSGPIEFSFIDFEQMRLAAPAAWDYAVLELSLRIHWLLNTDGPCFGYLASPERWSCLRPSLFREVYSRLEYVEQRIAFRVGRNTDPPPPEVPQDFERAIHVLSLCAATIRASYLSACQTRISPRPEDDTVISDYNETLRLAAACQALWRRPTGQRTDPRRVVVKTVLMGIIASNAARHLYTP
jgi:hypothetical protein